MCKALIIVSLFGILYSALPSQALAWQDQTEQMAEDLPTAKKVLDDYIAAKGGPENHRQIETIVSTGTIAIPQSNMRGMLKIYQAAPDKMYMEMNFEGQGKTVTIFNGQIGWVEQTAAPGEDGQQPEPTYTLLKGERLARFKVQSKLNLYLEIFEIFESVKCVAVEEFNGAECYVLVAEDPAVPPIKAYFSKESKLLVGSRISMLQEGEPGVEPKGVERLEITSTLSRYRNVGDVKMSHKAVAVFGGLSQVVVMNEIEIGAEVPETKFNVPAEIAEATK